MNITIKKCLTISDWLYAVVYKNEVLFSGLAQTRRDAVKEAFGACLFWLSISGDVLDANSNSKNLGDKNAR